MRLMTTLSRVELDDYTSTRPYTALLAWSSAPSKYMSCNSKTSTSRESTALLHGSAVIPSSGRYLDEDSRRMSAHCQRHRIQGSKDKLRR